VKIKPLESKNGNWAPKSVWSCDISNDREFYMKQEKKQEFYMKQDDLNGVVVSNADCYSKGPGFESRVSHGPFQKV
jgi:hypothetical protein